MKARLALISTVLALVFAHGGHEEGPQEGESMEQYAIRHMQREHHIDAFDLDSFFALHDLNSDGMWTPDEIEAIYGVHHPYSAKYDPDEEKRKVTAKTIVDAVLKLVDKNGDGVISMAEFQEVGLDGLPDYTGLGAEGHHYDVESEFFLHHEEIYHSTPETQTDESYNHPEDQAHFEHHETIELDEENKERAYQGLDPLKELPEDHDHDGEGGSAASEEKTPLEEAEEIEAIKAQDPNRITPMDGEGHIVPEVDRPNPRYTRQRKPNEAEAEEVLKAAREAKEQPGYGEGPDGYQRPRTKGDRARRNMPYKYKFRRSWGDF